MVDLLKQFYQDEHTREAVKEFMVANLKDKAVSLAFAGSETKHIKLAGEVIDEAWNNLELIYGKKEDKEKGNPAR